MVAYDVGTGHQLCFDRSPIACQSTGASVTPIVKLQWYSSLVEEVKPLVVRVGGSKIVHYPVVDIPILFIGSRFSKLRPNAEGSWLPWRGGRNIEKGKLCTLNLDVHTLSWTLPTFWGHWVPVGWEKFPRNGKAPSSLHKLENVAQHWSGRGR